MQALVEFNYEAHEPDELTIRKGDVIRDIKVSHGGWWEGTLGSQRGMFPDNFVKVIEQPAGARNSAEAKEEDVTLRNGPGRRYCKVLFSYEPCNDDELKLVPDEAIEYLGEVEEGWWRGRIKGRTGVFPSNFVTGPLPEEAERNKKDLCRVLFPYEANNDDELSLAEGDVVVLLSKEAPDKGWWKGELRGQVGFFPDNFVELIVVKNEHTDAAANQVPTGKTLLKHQTGKKKETAVVRKSLDTRNVRTDGTAKKMQPNSASSSLTGSLEKKPASNLISSLKRLVGESSSSANANSNSNSASSATNNGNGTAGTGLGEELDEVERGEGVPLSHLTASRAKAPRRRLPSTQHLRHQGSTSAPDDTNNDSEKLPEDNMTNGNSEVTAAPEKTKDDENDGMVAKARKRAPWVEELKLNQMERRKMGTDQKTEKNETKKDRVYSWVTSSSNHADIASKPELDGEDLKPKEREREKPPRPEPPVSEQLSSPPVSSPPAYVPYHLYSQLLDRIAALEEKQTVLQRKVNQLSEQVAPLVSNAASDRD